MSQANRRKPERREQGSSDDSDRITAEATESDPADDPRLPAISLVEIIGVPLRMIRLWIDTGAWPLPCSVCGGKLLFKQSDVESWLVTGAWPTGVHFRKGPRRPSRDGVPSLLHDGSFH